MVNGQGTQLKGVLARLDVIIIVVLVLLIVTAATKTSLLFVVVVMFVTIVVMFVATVTDFLVLDKFMIGQKIRSKGAFRRGRKVDVDCC